MLPWTEQYRPKSLEDFVGSALLDQLKEIELNGNDNPHLAFIGEGGVGKTSAVHALVRTWYPDAEDRKTMVMEINASDESGIQAIRERVIPFMKRQCKANNANNSFSKKILILDEADCMTPAAQACLRVPLEECIGHTLVFIMGNFVNRIIRAILSRCMVITFPRLSWDQIRFALERICNAQNIPMKAVPWDHLKSECTEHGDLRQSIEYFQFIRPFFSDGGNDLNDTIQFSQFTSNVPVASCLLEHKSIAAAVKHAESQAFTGQAWTRALYQQVMVKASNETVLANHLDALAEADYLICSGAHFSPCLSQLLITLLAA